ncbi:sensor domain-containing protein [Plantactinospora sp. B5E13]|uniref:sensor histidine kinase n=1 Tax=Plantactinospora sp. B5E13 TaxID=3153758 RepID=UPI00325D67CD
MPGPPPQTALAALAQRRFLLSGWPWRSAGYVLSTAPVALAAGVPLGLLALPWLVVLAALADGDRPFGALAALLVLAPLLVLVFGPAVALPLAALERWRLRLVDTRPLRSGHRRPPAPGLWPWLRTRYTDAATWRDLGYAALLVTVVPVLHLVALTGVLLIGVMATSPLLVADGTVSLGVDQASTVAEAVPYAVAGVLLLPAVPYLLAAAAGVHGALARALLDDSTGDLLRAELVEVARSRARLVDAFEAERRRIERDLHDGAQQRLVNLTIQLGLARLDLPAGTPAATALARAHEQAKQIMAELRELIHGIRPQLLTDRGLPAALDELADRAPVPVTVRTDLPDRPPGHLEDIAYFVVAEALANVAKHSTATRATVDVHERAGVLAVEVTDDGRGGADPARGTGLTGLADRIAVVDGRLLLSSPGGGPTVLRVELPCPSG